MLSTSSGTRRTIEPLSVEGLRARAYVVVAILAIFLLTLVGRLVFLQYVQHDHYLTLASAEHWRQSVLPARRGDIVDRQGVPLATSVEFESLYATTTEIDDPAGDARRLAPVLDVPEATLQALLSQRQSAPTLVRRWLSPEVADHVRTLALSALFLQAEPRRVYPQGILAAQLLGVVGTDNNGLSGLELQYNKELSGTPGTLVAERDTEGEAIVFGASSESPSRDGARLTLTIDRYAQWVAERELAGAIQAHQAIGGSVVILDPRNGAILAMASRPTYRPDDPDLYSPANVAHYALPAVTNAWEPGSIFKPITLAGALEAGLIAPTTTFYNQGYFTFAGGTIHDANPRPAGPMSMTDTLAHSSNVGAAWAATRLGAPRFYATARSFGIGQPTGVDLPGEIDGLLRLNTAVDWAEFDLAANAFGQGLTTTPLQMTAAMATIANGGVRMKPYVVQDVAGPTVSRSISPTVAARAIRPETAAALIRMLVAAVDDPTGEGHAARVDGYAIAGKTGTAKVPEASGYSPAAAVASFVGFAPADNPRFVVLVRIDQPQDTIWGGAVAAPAFAAITRQLLSYYQIPPSRPVSANGT